jgi:hypothetical protein
MKYIVTKQNKQSLEYNACKNANYTIQMKNYRMQMEYIEYKWKLIEYKWKM